MTDSVAPSTLTSTQAVNWDEVPITDVLELTPGTAAEKVFSLLTNCQARMKGRALGEIIGPISVSLHCGAGVFAVCAIGVVPHTSGATNTPSSVADILSCGGVVLRSGPTHGSDRASLRFLPGITTILKGATTTVLTGGPPHIFAKCSAINVADGKPNTDKVHLVIDYKLKLQGVDWIRPF